MKLLLHNYKNLTITVLILYLLLCCWEPTGVAEMQYGWISNIKMFLNPSSDPWKPTCCFLSLQHLPVGLDKITEVAEGYPFHYHIHSWSFILIFTVWEASYIAPPIQGTVSCSLLPLPSQCSPKIFWHEWHSFSTGVEGNAQPRSQSTAPDVQNQRFFTPGGNLVPSLVAPAQAHCCPTSLPFQIKQRAQLCPFKGLKATTPFKRDSGRHLAHSFDSALAM